MGRDAADERREGPGRGGDPPERLTSTLATRGYAEPPAVARVLLRYVEALLDEGRRVNLTAARTLDEAIDRVVLSALAVTRAWSAPHAPALVVDLGSGNGFPGVAAALAWPAARVLLVERRHRKGAAIARCVDRAGLEGARVVVCDGRELGRRQPDVVGRTDLVTVRAVGTLEEVTAMAATWLAPGGRIAHWKGRTFTLAERKGGEVAARRAGLVALPPLAAEDDAGPAWLVVYERSPGR